MRCSSRLVALSATLLALGMLLGCGPRPKPAVLDADYPPASPPPGSGNLRALLVGCTKYDSLPQAYWLEGPANDVVLLRELLVKRFGFPDSNVVTLADALGKDRRPTRANIVRAIEKLIQEAKPGDKIVITLSGHGSRQPEPNPPPDPEYAEPDGMDEIFLPCDIKNWDSETGTVTNAIIDDEIRIWTKQLTDKGASVWLVADSCHSGDLLRGNEKPREVKPDQLHIPKEAIKAAEERAAKRGRSRGAAPAQHQDVDRKAQHLVAIYAARTSEETVEKPMPDGKSYGLLSYTLCQILNRAREPLTYRALVREINAQYRGLGRTYPMPLVDGPDADALVLGTEKVAAPPVVLKRDRGGWTINAGLLQGMTEGTILAVLPSGAGSRNPIGHVAIAEAGTLESKVEPCAYGNLPKRENLPDGAGCNPVFINYGDFRLKVAADGKTPSGEAARSGDQAQLQKELQETFADRAHALVDVVADPRDAQWLVRSEGDNVYLMPAEGIPVAGARGAAKPPQLYGPYPRGGNLGEALRTRLFRVARAKNLLRLAAPAGPAQGDGDVKIGVRIRRFKDQFDRTGEDVDWRKNPVTFSPGEFLQVVLHNPNEFAVYPTVLYVDQDYGITPILRTELKPLAPGARIETPRKRVTRGNDIPENFVVIAVRDPGSPVDFSALAQESLEKARGARGMDMPLGRLLTRAMYGEGHAKGLDSSDFGNYTMGLIPWRTLPGPQPAPNP